MKNFLRIGIGVLVLTFCFGFKGCNDDDQKKFREGVKVGAVAVTEVNTTTQDFCKAELISVESCDKSLPHTAKAADIANRLENFVDTHPNLSPETRAEVLAFTDDILTELNAIDVQFKDPDHQRNYLLGLTAARVTVRSLRATAAK